jgi:type I restriction enzyme S subunit
VPGFQPEEQDCEDNVLFEPGDVLFGKLRPYLSKSWLADRPGCCPTELLVLRPDETVLYPDFLRYLTLSHQYVSVANGSAYGVKMPRTSWEVLSSQCFPIPPQNEQRDITAFLDRETSKIDALIEKKLILLKKLKEWEQRTLFDAVNFEAEKVGECWPVLSIVKPGKPVMYGIVLPGAHVPNGVPIIKGGDVEAGRLEPSLLSRTEVSIDARHSKSKVAEGDLIYAIRGSVGACRVVPSDLSGANLTQDVARISPGRDVTTEWMYLCLRSYFTFGQVEPRILGATIKGINIRDLERVRIPVPSIARQREVADRVGRELRARQQLNDRLRAQITHLREYRTALISAAVTGQIDVRGRG